MDPMTHEIQIQAAVYRARAKVRQSHLTKRADNPYFNSKYIPYEDIHQVVSDALFEEGLVYFQNVTHDGLNSVVVTHFVQSHEGVIVQIGETKLPTPKLTPQDAGSAMTYSKRYGAGALFGIIETKDDDANAAQDNATKTSAARTTTPQPARTEQPQAPKLREGKGWGIPDPDEPSAEGEMLIKGRKWNVSTMNVKQLGTVAYTGSYLQKHIDACTKELLKRVAAGDEEADKLVNDNSQP